MLVAERPAAAPKADGKKRESSGFYGQAFSGKGLVTRCEGPHRSPMFLLDEALSFLTQVGLACDPAKATDTQLEDQAMMSTLWTTGCFKKDLAGGSAYDIDWCAVSVHCNAHATYVSAMLDGTKGKDSTAIRRRLWLYSFKPMFHHNLKQFVILHKFATEQNVAEKLRQWPEAVGDVVAKMHELYRAFSAADIANRIVELTAAARLLYEDIVDETGAAQEECMYSRLFATSILGKFPEMTLRMAVVQAVAPTMMFRRFHSGHPIFILKFG